MNTRTATTLQSLWKVWSLAKSEPFAGRKTLSVKLRNSSTTVIVSAASNNSRKAVVL